MSTDTRFFKGYFTGALAAACYGLNPLFTLPLYAEGMKADSVLFYRYSFALIMIGFIMKLKGCTFRLKWKEVPILAAMGILFSLSSLTLFESYNYMDAGIASTLLFIYPILTAVIMVIFFKERVSWITTTSILLAFAGIALLTRTSSGGMVSLVGCLLVFLSSLSYAIYIVGVNRSFLKTFPSLELTFYALLFGLLVYIVRLRGGVDLQIPTGYLQWGCAFGLALFPTIISLVLMAVSIHHIGSTHASILGALEPVTALFIGVLVFHEGFTSRIALGIVLVLFAVTLIAVGNGKKKGPLIPANQRTVKISH